MKLSLAIIAGLSSTALALGGCTYRSSRQEWTLEQGRVVTAVFGIHRHQHDIGPEDSTDYETELAVCDATSGNPAVLALRHVDSGWVVWGIAPGTTTIHLEGCDGDDGDIDVEVVGP